jgi:hypothetical protein
VTLSGPFSMLKRALLFCLLAGLALAGSRTDPATGLLFPDSVSRWGFSDMRQYDPKALGVSYSYKSKLQREGAISCYIYNKGMKEIPLGAASLALRKEIEEVRWVVEETWRRQGGTAEDLIGVHEIKTDDGTAMGVMCAHRITHNGVTNVSLTALSAWKDHFLKIRFTFPGNNLDRAIHDLGGFQEFLTEMRAINEKVLDPLFLAPTRKPEFTSTR